MTGVARGKIIPAAKFSHDYGTRLPEGIFVTTVTGDYPDNYYDLVAPSDSDMVLRPDPERCAWCRGRWIRPRRSSTTATRATAACTTWRRAACCAACCNMYEEAGLQPIVAPELEFFLVQKNTDPDFPLQPPPGRSGRPETARQSYSIDAVNEFDRSWT
jgi:glutamine synthetase